MVMSAKKKNMTPGYLRLYETGALAEISRRLDRHLSRCTLCSWKCGVNRIRGERGFCRSPSRITVAKALPHFGEEPPLVGRRGSGTIFFSYCNLRCTFCQNYQISHLHVGRSVSENALADIMLSLQERGCHNINLVSATHFLPLVVRALNLAIPRGLNLPLVYNSNGYEDTETLREIAGTIDLYLPDAKYGGDFEAKMLSGAQNYVAASLAALEEMHRQVGSLEVGADGVARRGIIVRHLILPGDVSRTEKVLRLIKERLGTGIHVSLMGQYFPSYRASETAGLNRRISRELWQRCAGLLAELGFELGWVQPPDEVDDTYVPDFTKEDSWN